MNEIQAIKPLWDAMPIWDTSAPAEPGTGELMFPAIFQSAIDNVRQTDQDKVQHQYLLATGQLDNPADLMISMNKFQTSVDLLVQLRNKALDAYSELQRISL